MVKNKSDIQKGSMASIFSKGSSAGKKIVVLLSMILIGVLLIIYKGNYEYWGDQFIAYNQYLFGISLFLLIFLIIIVALNIKRILKHELLGTLFFSLGALIISIFYARKYFALDGLGEDAAVFIAIGAIIMVIGTLVLMRTGGFVGVCLVGLIIILLLSLVHMMGGGSLIQFDNNALQLINLSIIIFIVSFLLLVYHELKFFYLAKLMRDEKKLRKKKNYEKALNCCNKALLIYPYFVTGWNNKGNVLVNMGKKKDAVACYKKALDINPDYIPARKNLKQIEGA